MMTWQNLQNYWQSSVEQHWHLSKDQRDMFLSVGTIGLIAVLCCILLAMLTAIKLTKVTFLTLMLCLTMMYVGMAPEVKQRLKQQIRHQFS